MFLNLTEIVNVHWIGQNISHVSHNSAEKHIVLCLSKIFVLLKHASIIEWTFTKADTCCMKIYFCLSLDIVCSVLRLLEYASIKLNQFSLNLAPVAWGPVHTNPFSNKNGAVLLPIQLSSTLQRRERSPKLEPFENALQSGAIWKRCFLKTLFSSVDGGNNAIWKRWRHQNRHDRAPDQSTVSI